jgi:uncharacterized protein (TIGR03435 family)
MSRSVVVASLMALASCLISAQTAPAPLAFEVAAIKPNTSGERGNSEHGDNVVIVMTNISLKQLVEKAYDVRDFSFSGPDWLTSAHFDITVKPPAGFVYREQMRPMLQTLLAERFKLAVHRESKVMSAYALVRGKGDIKFRQVDPGDQGTSSSAQRGRYDGTRVTLAGFADFLQRQLDQPVVDKTDLKGIFHIQLEFSPTQGQASPDTPPPDSDGPSLYTALQEQLGLRLVSQKLPIEVVVVDHMERTPTEN